MLTFAPKFSHMKIGDKVRFLNEVGGGIITGFIGQNLVSVENEDGFDIPVPIREVVVVDADNYRMPPPSRRREDETSSAAAPTADTPEPEPADRPITYRPLPQERPEGEPINLFLCFMPVSPLQFSETDFEVYLVNDCNSFADFLYMSGENDAWQVRFRGTLEPNSKMYIETISHDQLNQLEHLCLQCLFYKQGKPFRLKPALSVRLRPNLTKFYKYHTFQPNEFFTEKVLTFDIIRHDKPVRQEFVQADDLREALLGGRAAAPADPARIAIKAVARRKELQEDIRVVDLHAEALRDTTSGMTGADILEYQLNVFRQTMRESEKQKGKKLVFIHGKGNGVLRNRLLGELHRQWPACTSQDASFREYGFGATMVIIH